MDNQKKIALFIPTYNVEGQIAAVLEKLQHVSPLPIAKIYFVDNQSSDNSLQIIKDWSQSTAKAPCEIYLNKKNVFLGGSTKLAFDLAIGDKMDYLICMHSDGQAEPEDLKKFFQAIETQEFDFILGSRFVSGSDHSNYSPLRYWFNLFFAYLQQIHLKQKVYDIGAYIGFNIETIKRLPYQSVPFDMGYHPYLILIASRELGDLRFKEFPITWGEVETTNINVWKYGAVHLNRIVTLLFNKYPHSGNYEVFESQRIF